MNKLKFCIPAVIILVAIMYKCIGCTYPGIKENQIETTNNNINTEGQILTDNIGTNLLNPTDKHILLSPFLLWG